MDIFDLAAKITLDSTGYESELNRLSKETEGFGSKIGGFLSGVGKVAGAGFVTAGTGAAAIIGKATEGYAEFEQLVGGVDKLFGESSATLQSYADMAFQTAGMSANTYMENATSFAAALVTSLEGDTAAAVEYADMAMRDMADNANVFGTSIESIQNAYSGFAKGNYSMLDNLKLGFGGSQAEMLRLLETAKELEPTFDAVFGLDVKGSLEAEFADIVEAINIVQESMGVMGATAAEASGTISGSVGSMQAAWENWLVGLGDQDADLSGLTTNLVSSFTTVVDNVMPIVGQIGTGLMESFAQLTGIDLSPVISKLTEFGTAIGESIGGITSAFQEGGVSGVIGELAAQFETLTGIDVSGIAESLAGIGPAVSESMSGIKSAFQDGGFSGVVDEIKGQFEELTGIDISPFTGKFEMLASALDGLVADGIDGAISGLVSSFENMTGIDLGPVGEGLEKFGGAVDAVAGAFMEGGLSAGIDELISQVEKLTGLNLTDIFGKITEAFNGVKEWLGGIDFSPFLESLNNTFSKLGEVGKSIGGLLNSIGEYLGILWEQLQPIIEWIGVNLVESINSALGILGAAIETVVGVIDAVINMAKASFDAAIALWNGDLEGLVTALKNSWGGALDFFKSIGEGIIKIFSGIVDSFKNIGAQMWDGLKSGFDAAVNKAKDWGSNVADSFKSFFGIHSPSRLFMEYGGFMAEGLGIGWDNKIDSVVRDMSKGVNVHGNIDFASSSLGKSSSAQINTMLSGMSERGGNYNINLVVDGRTLANVVFDPLNNISKQKGVAVGA
jgi:phage-related protein